MILAISTSSPVASLALFSPDGQCLAAAHRHAPRSASAALMEMMPSVCPTLEGVEGFIADTGPGSFTGVRVGVMMAKTWGVLRGVQVAGVPSYRLVSAQRAVVLPNKRGEWFSVLPGQQPRFVTEFPDGAVGYGPEVAEPTYPLAERCGEVWSELEWTDPMVLVPKYLVAPSISLPKSAFGAPPA